MTFTLKKPLSINDLPPGTTASIGTIPVRIPAVMEALQPYADTPECAACIKAAKLLQSCCDLARRADGAARGIFNGRGGEIARAQQAAQRDVPTSGWGDARLRQAALGVSDDKVTVMHAAQAFEEAAQAKQAEADQLATMTVAAMKAADDAVNAAVAAATGPRAFRAGFSVDEYAQIAGAREELGGSRPSRLNLYYDGVIASGDEKQIEKFEMAIIPVLDTHNRVSLRDFAGRINMTMPSNERDGGPVGEERLASFKLRSRIDDRRRQEVPMHVQVALLALSQLSGIFTLALGFNAMTLSRQDYESTFRSGFRPEKFALAPNWLARLAYATSPALGL